MKTIFDYRNEEKLIEKINKFAYDTCSLLASKSFGNAKLKDINKKKVNKALKDAGILND